MTSVTLSASPKEINFTGNTNEKICKNINLKLDKPEKIITTIKWKNNEEEKIISNYKINSHEYKISEEFNKNIILEKETNEKICLTFKEKGNYSGIIFYKIENKPAQIGIWINAKIEGNNPLKITGNFAKIPEKMNYKNSLTTFSIILLIILLFLLIKLKRKN